MAKHLYRVRADS